MDEEKGKKKDTKLTPEKAWKHYEAGMAFNDQLHLDEEVTTGENFFVGKQWEGVDAHGLPTPTLNFLKKVVLFTVANCTTDNLVMQASPLAADGQQGEMYQVTEAINEQFASLLEHNNIGGLIREFMRNAAVDGDGCMYTFWDPDMETGRPDRGGIATEIVENTRVYFGNPAERRTQKQPWIVITRREQIKSLKKRAKKAGVKGWDDIQTDSQHYYRDGAPKDDDYATVLMHFHRTDEGTIWYYECTKDVELKSVDMGIRLYPVVWLNWDYRQDNYHGQSLISGLIPNQIYVNRAYAMQMLSLSTTAYPKVIYDPARIRKWTNQVGVAIPVETTNGMGVAGAAEVINGGSVSPQVQALVQSVIDNTQNFMGATQSAMGEGAANNTSAIVALQRASNIPHEITKQNLYAAIEELGRIYLEFMGEYYGVRQVTGHFPKTISPELAAFSGIQPGQKFDMVFDFSTLKDHPMSLKLDVGASAYWSEITSLQTLDNLLSAGHIDPVQYLERVPEGYIPDKETLLSELKQRRDAMMGMQQGAPGGAPEQLVDNGEKIDLLNRGGRGNQQLAQAIRRGQDVKV